MPCVQVFNAFSCKRISATNVAYFTITLHFCFLQHANFLFVFSGQNVSLNATYSLGTSYDQQDNLQEADYTDDVVNLGAEGCEEGDVEEEGYQQEGEEEYTEEYSQDDNAEEQMDYTGEVAEGDDGYQDEVLDIQINEPIDGEFQVSSHICLLTCKSLQMHTHTHVFPLPFSVQLYCIQKIMSVFLSR